MKNYDVLVAETMVKIYNVFIEYQNDNIDINEFLLKRFNIVFEAAYMSGDDIHPYKFLTALHFDLFREAEILHEIGFF